jgi:protocatechuate 3,4-dioxygenase beta subunit
VKSRTKRTSRRARPEPNGRRDLLGALGGLGIIGLLDCGGTGAKGSNGSHASGATTSHGEGIDDAGHEASNAANGEAGKTTSDDSAVGLPEGNSETGTMGGDLGADSHRGTCVLDPTLTKGPFWVDEKLDRSDITMDTNNGAIPNPRPGLPLTLQFTVFAYAAGACSPLEGAQVDVWHCDAGGTYSDTLSLGTAGQNFLRGYQKTDANGVARFTTIYPGWYAGRCIHIHVKVRMFDAASNTTTEATTQVFFDDSVTASVCRNASPYNQRGVPGTPNASDAFYGNHTELLLNLRGDPTSGYAASIDLGVQVGAVQAG